MSFNKQDYPKSNYNSGNYQGYSGKSHKKYRHYQGEGHSSLWRHNKPHYNREEAQKKEEVCLEEEPIVNDLKPYPVHMRNDQGYYDEGKQEENYDESNANYEANQQFKTKLPQQQNHNNNVYQYNQNAFGQLNSQQAHNGNNCIKSKGTSYFNPNFNRGQPFNAFYPYLNRNEQHFNNANRNTYINNEQNAISSTFDQLFNFNHPQFYQIPEFYPNGIRSFPKQNPTSIQTSSTNHNTLQTNSFHSNSESSSIQQASPMKKRVISNTQSSLSSVSQSPKSELNKYPYNSPMNKPNQNQMPLINPQLMYPMVNSTPNKNHPLSNSPQLRYPIASNPHYYNQMHYSPNLFYNYNPHCQYPLFPNPNHSNTPLRPNNIPMSYFSRNRTGQTLFAPNAQGNSNDISRTEPTNTTHPNQRREIRSVKSEKNLWSSIANDDNSSTSPLKQSPTEKEEEKKEALWFQKVKVKVLLPDDKAEFFECEVDEKNVRASAVKFATANRIENQDLIDLLIYKIEDGIRTINLILRYNLSLKEKQKLLQIEKIIKDNSKEVNNTYASSMYEFEENGSFFQEANQTTKPFSLNLTQ